ncbi:neprilysin-1-like isoform X2 [Ornithodoros turicata]|uniref:neprilysin-1-like isoform X2 n=1 Tax=Ornithodoros turicata TaxID=34597 RepID=UPI0031399218
MVVTQTSVRFRAVEEPREVSVTWRRFLVLEVGFMTIVTIVMVVIGHILSKRENVYADDPCQSEACKQAFHDLEVISNASADPCEDFYEYVCGRWRHIGGVYSATWSMVSSEAIAQLKQDPAPQRSQTSSQKAAVAYRTCLDEVVRKMDLPTATHFTLGFFRVTWESLLTKANDMTAIVDYMISMSILHRISIGTEIQISHKMVYIGAARSYASLWASDPKDVPDIVEAVVEQTLPDNAENSNDANEALHIDLKYNAAMDVPEERHMSVNEAFQEANFGVPVATWIGLLNDQKGKYETIGPTTAATVTNYEALRTLSQLLQAARPRVRAFFLYLHTLAFTVQVELFKGIDILTKAANAEAFCQKILRPTLLVNILEAVIADRLGAAHYGKDVLAIAVDVDDKVTSRLHSSWLGKTTLSDALKTLSSQHKFFFWKTFSENVIAFEHAFLGLSDMTDNFYENYYNVRSFWRDVAQWLLCKVSRSEFFRYIEPENGICSSTASFAPPAFYAGAERFVNIASIGYLYALKKKFKFSFNTTGLMSDSERNTYRRNSDCVERQMLTLTRPQLWPSLDGKYNLEEVLFHVLALRSAYDASQDASNFRATQKQRHRESRLFFRRACSMHCHGSPDVPESPGGLTPRQKCNHVVRHTKDFYTVFKCFPYTRLASVEACQLI